RVFGPRVLRRVPDCLFVSASSAAKPRPTGTFFSTSRCRPITLSKNDRATFGRPERPTTWIVIFSPAERRQGGCENFQRSPYANSPRGATTAAVGARNFFGGSPYTTPAITLAH